ncbi:MAG TPA: 3-dehydroquinate synthase [Brumimicrobium sp.]|nr:3-dehydroquinate synthase [Brumimicrobium sp.]
MEKVKFIKSKNHNVEVGDVLSSSFGQFLDNKYKNSKKIIIVDENTHEKCLPYLLENYDALNEAEIIVLPPGEENKTIEICYHVWDALTNYEIQRKDLIVNLGGGVVTDMGGFIASIYKRGIDYINIPTTLLSIVDASVGGKIGVNFGHYKNQLGMFSVPKLTVCDPVFLATLDMEEVFSGRSEMIKHGLIADAVFFQNLINESEEIPSLELIERAISIKTEIVDKDFKEEGERKKLNFGHTIGHAIESFLLEQEIEITHGECVAWGMLVETHLSFIHAGLSEKELKSIETLLRRDYLEIPVNAIDFKELIAWMKHDKKNQSEKINFTLLQKIGVAKIDYELEEEEILSALTKVF